METDPAQTSPLIGVIMGSKSDWDTLRSAADILNRFEVPHECLQRRHPRRPDTHVQVKAAGGVRDLDALVAVRALGVSRRGATRTAAMMDEARIRLGLDPIVTTTPGPAPAG